MLCRRDGDDIKVFLLEGYLDLKCAFSGYDEVPFAGCAVLTDICTLNTSIAGTGIDSTGCRLGMADAFDTDFTLRKAVGNSTDVPDLPVCLTDLGLGNGSINMVAGMLIVSATVLLGVVEQISGMYALRSSRSAIVVGLMITFHVLLAFTLLIASRRRIATVAVSAACGFSSFVMSQLNVCLLTHAERVLGRHGGECDSLSRNRNRRPRPLLCEATPSGSRCASVASDPAYHREV